MLLAYSMADLGTNDALIVALLGYGIVFAGLIALMIVITIIGKIFIAKDKKKAKAAAVEAPVSEPEPVPAPTAPGTAGQLKIYDVEPKTAAMLMAIVADKLGKPLNELRFISIKEVK